MSKPIKKIAVDLTPILPGGGNGGAKIFVLELLRQFAEMHPQTKFILLTQAASHDELAILDRSNVLRHIVVGETESNSGRARVSTLLIQFLSFLPSRLRNKLNRLRYKLGNHLKKGSTASLLTEMEVDLLFCPFTAPTYHELGIPTVCTIYDLQYKTYPEFFSAEDVAHRDYVFTEACSKASALTAISDYSRDVAIAHGNLDPTCIRTIHLRLAKRLELDANYDKSMLDSLGLHQQKYLIYPANFWQHKNHEMLFTAFGMASHAGLPADIKLVCTGSPGKRQDWLMNAVSTMGLAKRVIFPGYLSNTELAVLISNSGGVIYPSLYEGFGLPIIEAMTAGVPVACSNITSIPEVAANATILFDPKIPEQISRSIVSLVEDEALRNQLIEAGKQRANEFIDTERMAKEYWELFQCAIESDGKYTNFIVGNYADGWVGGELKIQVAPLPFAKTLEIELFAPDWLPLPRLKAKVVQGGDERHNQVDINCASSAKLSIPLSPAGKIVRIKISPTFVPVDSGYGDDPRELSVMLQHCHIVCSDGHNVELYSGESKS